MLDSVSLTLRAGETVAVMGRSGSGKSTLLAAVLGLLRPRSGTIMICGHRMRPGQGETSSRIRREYLGMVFQDGCLIDELSPTENVMLPALVAQVPAQQALSQAHDLLSALGVPNDERPARTFSGGERQRIAIARALINRPLLLIADEPTGSLDPMHRDQVMEALTHLPSPHPCALLLVTHDPVVAAYANRVLTLDRTHLSTAPGGAP